MNWCNQRHCKNSVTKEPLSNDFSRLQSKCNISHIIAVKWIHRAEFHTGKITVHEWGASHRLHIYRGEPVHGPNSSLLCVDRDSWCCINDVLLRICCSSPFDSPLPFPFPLPSPHPSSLTLPTSSFFMTLSSHPPHSFLPLFPSFFT